MGYSCKQEGTEGLVAGATSVPLDGGEHRVSATLIAPSALHSRQFGPGPRSSELEVALQEVQSSVPSTECRRYTR